VLIRLKILFKYDGYIFIGQVRRQINGGTSTYCVDYILFNNPSDVESVQIYRGKGKDDRICWRQRVDEFEPQLKDTVLIETIGRAIQIQENIESK
jgi:hypothetical protein